MNSDLKISFMLDKNYLDDFVNYISSVGQQTQVSSEFQILSLKLDNSSLLVYQSGIVIFEHHPIFKEKISKFLIKHGVEDPDFQKYVEHIHVKDENKIKPGWDTTPKGVWLTKTQLDTMLDKISQMDNIKQISPKKHELYRFCKEEQVLVVNRSQVVYTIGGFRGIYNLLRNSIEANNPYKKYSTIIAIDEQGRWNRIGPVVINAVILNPNEIVKLQMQGVKDSSLSRSLDYEGFNTILDEIQKSSMMIEPFEINKNVNSKENYIQYLESRYKKFLNSLDMKFDPFTLLAIDEQLIKIIESSNLDNLEVVPRKKRASIALGIASMIAELELETWRKKIQNEMGIFSRQLSLDDVKSINDSDKIVKNILITRNI